MAPLAPAITTTMTPPRMKRRIEASSSSSSRTAAQSLSHTQKQQDKRDKSTPASLPMYHVPISLAWLVLALGSSVLFSFVLGQAARVCLFPLEALSTTTPSSIMTPNNIHQNIDNHALPPQSSRNRTRRRTSSKAASTTAHNNKKVVTSDYTSKDFSTGLSQATHSFKPNHNMARSNTRSISSMGKRKRQQGAKVQHDNGKGTCSSSDEWDCLATTENHHSSSDSDDDSSSSDEDDDEWDELGIASPPLRQHWRADVWNIPSSSLSKEDFVVQTMNALVADSNVTLLSYHCYRRHADSNKHRSIISSSNQIPTATHRRHHHQNHYINQHPAVTCAGIAAQGHVALHSWPRHGLLTVDIMATTTTSSRKSNQHWNVPRLIEGLNEATTSTTMLSGHDHVKTSWALQQRGMDQPQQQPQQQQQQQQQDNDGLLASKHLLQNPSSPRSDTTFESLVDSNHNDRRLYGALYSRHVGHAALFEALVHPAMLVHQLPQRVALVGGLSVLPMLQQVLTHSTVQEVAVVVTVERDVIEGMMEAAVPEWNDCSDLVGSALKCWDDPRVHVSYQSSATAWLLDYGQQVTTDQQDALDVLILVEDAVDRNTTHELALAIGSALDVDEGILVLQQGTANALGDANPIMTRKNQQNIQFMEQLHHAGFSTIRDYGETHTRLGAEQNFVVGLREEDDTILGRWFANEAEFQVALHERTMRTHSGRWPVQHLDGATMHSYHFPSRSSEYVFCLAHPNEEGCRDGGHGFEPERTLVPVSSLEVKRSTVENAGRGIFVKEDAPAGSYFYADGCVDNMHIPDLTVRVLDAFLEHGYTAGWEVLMGYTDGYGFSSESFGERSHDVDPGIATFVNHGCNGTMNVGSLAMANVTEHSPVSSFKRERSNMAYNPASDRSVRTLSCVEDKAIRDIAAGEEILNNYMAFEQFDAMEAYAAELREECSGQHGSVSTYEKSKKGPRRILDEPLSSDTSNETKCPTCEDEQPLS